MNLREYAAEILERIKDVVVEILEGLTGEVLDERRLVRVPVQVRPFRTPVRARSHRSSY